MNAYTLIELMVGVAVAAAIFATILTSGVAIFRSCAAADDFSNEIGDQMRALDYIARDLRGALSVNISTGVLTLTVPDAYSSYDADGNPGGNLGDPVIVNGSPRYGDAANPMSITYSVSGGNLVRQQTIPSISQTTSHIVASHVASFQSSFVSLSTAVNYSITFDPLPHPGVTALRPATTATATVAARMLHSK